MTDELVTRCARAEKRATIALAIAAAGVALGAVGVVMAMRAGKDKSRIVLEDADAKFVLTPGGFVITRKGSEDTAALFVNEMLGVMFQLESGDTSTVMQIQSMGADDDKMATFALGSPVGAGGSVNMTVTSARELDGGYSSGFAKLDLVPGPETADETFPGGRSIRMMSGYTGGKQGGEPSIIINSSTQSTTIPPEAEAPTLAPTPTPAPTPVP